jgi:hypothetical protein
LFRSWDVSYYTKCSFHIWCCDNKISLTECEIGHELYKKMWMNLFNDPTNFNQSHSTGISFFKNESYTSNCYLSWHNKSPVKCWILWKPIINNDIFTVWWMHWGKTKKKYYKSKLEQFKTRIDNEHLLKKNQEYIFFEK